MTDDDVAFVAFVYASTRRQELASTGWPQTLQDEFLSQQHDAQHRHYRVHYPGAEWLIIEGAGKAIGRLYRVVWPDEIRIIDISLLPEARSGGIGTAILTGIQTEARSSNKSVSIHVEKHNPARHLYQRLGFRVVEDKGVYELMEWSPPRDPGR